MVHHQWCNCSKTGKKRQHSKVAEKKEYEGEDLKEMGENKPSSYSSCIFKEALPAPTPFQTEGWKYGFG